MSTTKMSDLFGKDLKVRGFTKEEVSKYCHDSNGDEVGFFALEDSKYFICSERSHADYILEAVQAFDSNQENIENMKVEIKYLTDYLELVVGLRDKSMNYASEWIEDNADTIDDMLKALEDDHLL